MQLAHARGLPPTIPDVGALSPYDRAAKDVYGDRLFHGRAFALIDVIHGISPSAMKLAVRGLASARWPNVPGVVDAAALDAGLQAALLFAHARTGGAFLPTGIARLASFAEPRASYELTLVARNIEADRVVVDLFFADEAGALVMTALGVEVHRRPDDVQAASAAPASGARG
jgi:hypothetical protein